MPKPPNFPTLAPNRRVQVAVLLSGLVILLFIVALSGFLSAWRDMKEAVRDNQASHLANEVDTNFQLAISKGKNFAILKDELNKTRTMGYFKKAQERYAELSDFEQDQKGRDLLYKLGAALRSVEFSLGILTAQAKKSDPAGKLYNRYLKDITIDFDEASQAYVEYLNQKIQLAQAESNSRVFTGLWVALSGILLAIGVIVLNGSVVENLRRALAGEEALRESGERLRLFDGLTEEAIMIHDQGVIVEVNQALTHLLGYEHSEVIGKHVSAFMTQASVEDTKTRIEKGYPEGFYEITAKRKDGTTFPLLVHGRDFIFRGRKMRASSGWDITERKRAEQNLRHSEENFRALIEQAPDAILVTRGGVIAYANQRCLALLGFESIKQLTEKTPLEVVSPEDRPLVTQRVENALTGGENPSTEIRLLRRDGSPVEVESTSVGIRFEGISASMVIFRDITDRKKAEEVLRHSEAKFRSLIENSYDIITLLDRNGQRLYESPSLERILGYKPGERKGSTFETQPPEERELARRVFEEALANPGVSFRTRMKALRKDGKYIDSDMVITNLLGNPAVGGIVINGRDITEQKKAEAALKSSEEKFRSLIENSHDIISITGRDGVMSYISPSVKRVLGYDPSERVGRGYAQIIHPDDLERMKGEFVKLLGMPGASWTVEFRLLHKDGSWRHVVSTGTNLLEDSLVQGIVYNLRDVTEKKMVEDALRHSEESFRNLIENSNDVISVVGTDMKARYVSSSIRKIMGYDPGERVGHSFMEIVHPDDKAMAIDLFREFVYKPGVTVSAQVRALHKNGSWRYIDAVATNLLNHPTIQGIILNYRDVTEKKLAEQALLESEESFRDLIEKSPDAMIVHNPGKIIYVNEALLRLLGYGGHHQLLGKNPQVIVHPDDREAVNERVRRLKPGEGYNPPAERRFLTREGKVVPVEVVSFSIIFQGEPMVVAVARDLTERKLAEENFRNLIEKSPDAMVIHRMDEILYANPAFLALTGYEKKEELVGQPPEVMIPPEERDKVMKRVENLDHLDGVNPPVERKVFRKDGAKIPVEVVSFSILYQGKMAVVAVMRDLTERKETEQALMRFERLSTIGEMAAGIAHEIRNPLSAISAAAQILKRKKTNKDPGDDRFLETILAQTDRLNRLVLDTLQYARAEKPLEKENILLKEALESAVRLCQIQFGPSHAKVKVEWDLPKKDPGILANPQRIQQILINLILNAYQIMPEGGKIKISLKSDKNSAFIRVEDEGPGIKDEDMKRIFEPFFTTKGGGSGLGLALSQRIAKEHGGEINLERLTPHGTAFTLRIPLGADKEKVEKDKKARVVTNEG